KAATIAGASGHGDAGDQPPDLALDALRQFDLGARQRHAIERRAPALDVLLLIGDRKLPEVDLAWTCIGQRLVQRIGLFSVDAAVDRLVAKYVIDGLQDRLSRPEGIGERDRLEFQPNAFEFLLQL